MDLGPFLIPGIQKSKIQGGLWKRSGHHLIRLGINSFQGKFVINPKYCNKSIFTGTSVPTTTWREATIPSLLFPDFSPGLGGKISPCSLQFFLRDGSTTSARGNVLVLAWNSAQSHHKSSGMGFNPRSRLGLSANPWFFWEGRLLLEVSLGAGGGRGNSGICQPIWGHLGPLLSRFFLDVAPLIPPSRAGFRGVPKSRTSRETSPCPVSMDKRIPRTRLFSRSCSSQIKNGIRSTRMDPMKWDFVWIDYPDSPFFKKENCFSFPTAKTTGGSWNHGILGVGNGHQIPSNPFRDTSHCPR